MTDDARKAAILAERARKLAMRGADAAHRRVRARVVVVLVGREPYGLPVEHLREIVRASPIAPLPGLPPFIPGIAAVRGELLSVVDLAELHGRGTTGSGGLFAVVESASGAVALRIESVVGFRDVHEDEVAENLAAKDADDALAFFVTKDFVSVIDVAHLLASRRLVVGGRAT